MKVKNIFGSKAAVYAVALASLGLMSCEKDYYTNGDEAYGVTPKISATVEDIALVEADSVFTIPVTLDKAFLDADIPVEFRVKEGTAVLGEDFTIKRAYIPGGYKEGKIELTTNYDEIYEEDEYAIIEIVAGPNSEMAAKAEFRLDLFNYATDDLEIELSWEPKIDFDKYPVGGATDFADIDLYVAHNSDLSDGIDINDYLVRVYSAETGGFEHITVPADAPDGQYVVFGLLYDAFNTGEFGDFAAPVRLNTYKLGQNPDIAQSIVPAAGEFSSLTPDYADDGALNFYGYLVIDKVGTEFTVTNIDDYEAGTVAEKVKNLKFNYDYASSRKGAYID